MRALVFMIGLPLLGAADPAAAVRVLSERCLSCHSAAAKMAGVDLSDPAKVAASKAKIRAVLTYDGKIKMPPTGKLAGEEAALLNEWLDAGSPWPSDGKPMAAAPSWWAFQPVKRPLNVTGIDAAIREKLAAKGLAMAPPADRRTLIRRVTFDLTGLPPAHAEIEAFAADPAADAYEKLVDRLLASPRYGEKWGKHWLDLVRYGDTSGFEQDPYQLYAWRYRDYVIDSFNQDKPYDRFILEQIAGDELFEEPEAQQGTGYYTVGTNRDMLYKVEDINRIESLTDFVDTTASVFLGLTVGCARCHDHKFDPIPQRDYYRMQAIFAPFQKTRVFLHYNNARSYDLGENTRTFQLYEIGAPLQALMGPHRQRLKDARLAKLAPEVGEAFRTADDKRTPEQKALFEMHAKAVEPPDAEVLGLFSKEETDRLRRIERRLIGMIKNYGPGPMSPGMTDVGRESPKTYLPSQPDMAIKPGFLTALGGGEIADPPVDSPTTQRRKALAQWIASPGNPLTARVMVNRIWQYHFGRGLLSTSSDFGTRAGQASHPELLDWLASEFVADGWSIKKMHKRILLSAAYQQGAKGSPKALEMDPENALLAHFPRRRLEAEEVRDAVLAAAGSLNLKMGGRPVVPPLAVEELYGMSQPLNSAWVVTDDPAEHNRRSIYMISRRNFRMPLLEAFDRPEGVLSCSRRDSSTTAPQSLSLLNGQFTMAQAAALAARVETAADPVAAAWQATLGRDPDASERERARAFVEKQTATLGSRRAALTELARGLFNLNEFLYVE
jgi:cytochrome c551/c552